VSVKILRGNLRRREKGVRLGKSNPGGEKMDFKEIEASWREMSEAVIEGMKAWRQEHPKATMKGIETRLDEQLARLRAKMLQDTALVSQVREWSGGTEAVKCPECGTELKARGQQKRTLQTNGGQEVVLEREYGECPACGAGLFPPG
jgi:YgiT-type zinc finger domain-containing protein